LCAGGYFGAREVQFEMGTSLEVHGQRDLAFFPGVARGAVFPGFDYKSMRGSTGVFLFYFILALVLFCFFYYLFPPLKHTI
jgi:biotin--protein ligase